MIHSFYGSLLHTSHHYVSHYCFPRSKYTDAQGVASYLATRFGMLRLDDDKVKTQNGGVK